MQAATILGGHLVRKEPKKKEKVKFVHSQGIGLDRLAVWPHSVAALRGQFLFRRDEGGG